MFPKICVQEVKKKVNSVINFRRVTHFWLCLLETQVHDHRRLFALDPRPRIVKMYLCFCLHIFCCVTFCVLSHFVLCHYLRLINICGLSQNVFRHNMWFVIICVMSQFVFHHNCDVRHNLDFIQISVLYNLCFILILAL